MSRSIPKLNLKAPRKYKITPREIIPVSPERPETLLVRPPETGESRLGPQEGRRIQAPRSLRLPSQRREGHLRLPECCKNLDPCCMPSGKLRFEKARPLSPERQPQSPERPETLLVRPPELGESRLGPQEGRRIQAPRSLRLPSQRKEAPSRIQRFDKSVNEELTRLRNPETFVQITTSDPTLVEAASRLARAEQADRFSGAVKAAEEAAANAEPTQAEAAATAAAKSFEAEILDVVQETIPGEKPIQVLGYVGITRPKYAAR